MQYSITPLFMVITLSAQTVSSSLPGGENHSLRDPLRDPWQKPEEVVRALSFSPTETVAVIEHGYPYFAPRIVPLVKKVYAINTDARAFQGRGQLPPSASTIVGSSSDPKIAGLNVDTLMMVDVLRFLPQRPPYYQGLAAGLKRGGRLIIIDRILPAAFPLSDQISDAILERELSPVGFSILQRFTLLPYQYFIVFHI